MDEQLQAKIQEARDAGYSDEEINHYLNTKELPVEQPINRSDEALGTMQAIAPQAAIYAGEGAALGYGAKVLKDTFGNRPPAVPVAPPVQQTVPAQQAVNQGRPNLSVQSGGTSAPKPTIQPVAPTGAQSIIQKLALDKVLKNAGAIGAGMSVAQGLFGTSPEEVAILKEAEARKRAQGWKPLNER